MAAVLLVDDDVELAEMLGDYLAQDGFVVTTLHDGLSGAEAALSGQYAIAVLDVMMPGLSGVEVLRRIRAVSAMPVLMLTAKGDDMDRIVGLELGADDYVPKPCQPRELAARLRAILKRTGSVTTQPAALPIIAGPLTVWPTQRRVELQGQPVGLTSTEFGLLAMLARAAGQTVSKAALSEDVLGRPLTRFDRSIDVHISSIRQKLGPLACLADGRPLLQTVIRQGYQLLLA